MSLLSWIWARLRGKAWLGTPESVTLYIVQHHAQMKPADWVRLESAVRRRAHGGSQSHLIYALRVSSVLPTLKKLEALASRWSVANCGAGDAGLCAVSRREPNRELVQTHLQALYLDTLRRLLAAARSAHEARLVKARSDKTRAAEIEKWRSALADARTSFVPELPGARDLIESELASISL